MYGIAGLSFLLVVLLSPSLRDTSGRDLALVRSVSSDTRAPEHLETQARIVSFGQIPSFVDYLLIRFLTEDDSITHVTSREHAVGYYTLDLATRLDPAFFSLYTSGASFLAVVRNDGIGAARLLERGERFRTEELSKYPADFRARFWSQEWSLPAILGYTYLFELKDMVRAAEVFKRAGEVPSAPQFLKNLAERLSQPYGAYETAIRLTGFWIRGAESAGDQVKLEALKRRLFFLEVQYFMRKLNDEWRTQKAGAKARAAFVAKWDGATDPWGGKLGLRYDKWVTSTSYEPQMGLE